jgi:energy-coupling factor transporter ATP-binding protein EcfA2
MRLKKLTYCQHEGQPEEWAIKNMTFDAVNLVVGRNAVGKTRAINVISGLAKLLSEKSEIKWTDGQYDVVFDSDQKTIHYTLHYHDKSVAKEELTIGKRLYLTRGKDGSGKMYFDEEKIDLRFQTPLNEVASFARRDSIQHPFLEYLYDWGKNLVTYRFGKTMGQEALLLFHEKENFSQINIKETERVVRNFAAGMNQFRTQYTDLILDDMKKIGYNLTEIDIGTHKNVSIQSNIPIVSTQPIMGILVQEKELDSITYQTEMSQGMFRALSLVIQINYFLLLNQPGTILIDDIGEGLDFDRASSLIQVLVDKALKSKVQLIMTTNDRFTMNKVPIEFWTILDRHKNTLHCYNYRNSKDIFDEFELTGLSNFDLFSTNFYLKGKIGNTNK